MSTTVKVSIQRLRQIFAVHFSKFCASFIALAVVLLVLGVYNPATIFNWELPVYSNALLAFACIIFFLSPAFIYLTSNVSAKVRGVTETKINPEAMKQTLFLSLGVLWASLGALLFVAISSWQLNLMAEVAVIAALLSWYGICRIALMYVRG